MNIKFAICLFLSLVCLTAQAYGADRFVVTDTDEQEVFTVGDGGAVSMTGNVAIGTTSSEVPLLVQSGDTGHLATFFRTGEGNDAEIQIGQETADHKAAVIGFNKSGKYYYMSVYGLGYNRLVFNSSGYLGVGTTTPSYPLEMASGAYITTGGVWTNASSREYKKDIKELTGDEAMDALKQLSPVKFSYKVDSEDRHVGFIAEDVPDLVATKDRKGMSPMDVVAVLTKVVQKQQRVVQEQRATIAELSRRLAVVERGVKSE